MSDLPPYAALLKLATEVDPNGGSPLFVMPGHDGVLGRPGFLHGGAIGGLCEFAAYGSLRAALSDDTVRMKPITVTVDYLRGGKLVPTRARAELVGPVEEFGRLHRRRAGDLDLTVEVRRPVLERLEFADQPAELLALLEVFDGHVGRARGDPDHLRRSARPPRRQRAR